MCLRISVFSFSPQAQNWHLMDIYWCQLKQHDVARLTHIFEPDKKMKEGRQKGQICIPKKAIFPSFDCKFAIYQYQQSDIIQFTHLRAGLIQLNQLNQWSSSHKFKSGQLCSKGSEEKAQERERTTPGRGRGANRSDPDVDIV